MSPRGMAWARTTHEEYCAFTMAYDKLAIAAMEDRAAKLKAINKGDAQECDPTGGDLHIITGRGHPQAPFEVTYQAVEVQAQPNQHQPGRTWLELLIICEGT